MKKLLRNVFSTLVVMGVGYGFAFQVSPWHHRFTTGQVGGVEYSLVGLGVLALYGVALPVYYYRYPWITAKAWVLFRCLLAGRLSSLGQHACRALILKAFFVPYLLVWFLNHSGQFYSHLLAWQNLAPHAPARVMFDGAIHGLVLHGALLVDTFFFLMGYLIELPRTRIRSVDPYWLGWVVCLACYPPFNDATGAFLQWQSKDLANFVGTNAHLFLNSCALLAMVIYAWASVALGLRASNLTYRSVVGWGPYRWVRHPAYAAKNLAWWIGALPTIDVAFQTGVLAGIYALFAMAGWTLIYMARALTEERHLRAMAPVEYGGYCDQVRWRFIPGLV